MEIIKSTSYSQDEILQSILTLYCPKGFELDPTYSKGGFYRNIPEPRLKYDVSPQTPDTKQADCRALPLANDSLSSIIFDPPFVAATTFKGIMTNRFGSYPTVYELWSMYKQALKEFYRILQPHGILVFKCQDTVHGRKQYLSHVEVVNLATRLGFHPRDVFILLAKHRIIRHNMKVQHHARKFHSYFLIFEKKKENSMYTRIT